MSSAQDTAPAANTAVRERRRRSSQGTLQRMDAMKAMTAAEYSRRQFILNYAASTDTTLLIPGRKADVTKAAEDWVGAWLLSQHNAASGPAATGAEMRVTDAYFKYTVDARLWSALVGDDTPFPFTFMRAAISPSPDSKPDETSTDPASPARRRRNKSEGFLLDKTIQVDLLASVATAKAQQQQQQQQQQQAPNLSHKKSSGGKSEGEKKEQRSRRSSKAGSVDKPTATASELVLDNSSLNSIEDLKLGKTGSAKEAAAGEDGPGAGGGKSKFMARWKSKSWGSRKRVLSS